MFKIIQLLLSAWIILLISAVNIFSQGKILTLSNWEKRSFLKNETLKNVQYPGDSTINVTYYKLNLTITYQPDYLIGIVTVNAKSNTSLLKNFFLDLQDTLKVDSVISSDRRKLTYTHSGAKLIITLDTTYNIGQLFSVNIFYRGVPGSSGFGSFEFGSHNNKPVIWSLSEPYGASDWWPCKDTPADKADSSDVWITCDTSLTGVSNGLLQTVINNGDGTHTFKWKNTYPIAQYLISIAISNYTKYTLYYKYTVKDSMPVDNYIYPEDFDSLKSDLDGTINMLNFFSNKYGLYPFIKEKYGQAQFGWGGGMEHQTITSLGVFGTFVQAHELSHQWFGDKITCRDWQDIWLNEGFATFSEALYAQALGGDSAYYNYMQNLFQSAKSAKGSVYVEDISSVNNIFNYNRTYAKGAVVLHMLRGIVGDSTFFKILNAYLTDPKLAYGTAITADFEADAEKVYGKSLSYFFDEWIFGQNYPDYNVKWNFVKNSTNTTTVTLNISQSTNINPQFFTMPIQIKIILLNGDTTVTVFNNAAVQQFKIAINGIPRYIIFDPNNWILHDISVIDSVDLTKPKLFMLNQNFPNPFNPSTEITYSIPIQEKGYIPVKLSVYDITGKIVSILVDELQSAGNYAVIFPSTKNKIHLSSGIYIYTLRAGLYFAVKKMIMIK
jgi:aminopeptidase N